jgi:hydrogenase nickel incorporation protein HypB
MCTTCGCSAGETRIEGHHMHEHEASLHEHAHGAHETTHVHADGTMHSHPHTGPHEHDAPHEHHHHHPHADGTAEDAVAAHAHAPGMTAARRVQIERDILGHNNALAADNRRLFAEHGILALNLVSSPGAGKTTLLVETIRRLQGTVPVAVIEGDQQTSFDADRIRATGVRAVQINTGKGCHLDAHQVGHALEHLVPADESVLFIENVGNLVCPAAFDLGEAHKVVVLSVTEGDDKPLKYPDMFAAASLMVLNKIDLAPHVNFDVQRAIDHARRVRPGIEVLPLSATTGAGTDAWLAWIRRGAEAARERRRDEVARLKRRIAELEAQVGAKS